MVLDFALMSVLLVVAHLLRSRVRLLQDLYLPSALIAGLLAFVGGHQVLDKIPFQVTDAGEPAMARYPSLLVVLLFATLFLGARTGRASLRETVRNVGDTFFYNLATELGQYGAALLFGLVVLAPLFPGLNEGFALMLPAGFAGGHGTATAIGGVLGRAGWDEALSVGYTLATVGLLAGNLGGMALVFLATRRGWTRLVQADDPDTGRGAGRGSRVPDQVSGQQGPPRRPGRCGCLRPRRAISARLSLGGLSCSTTLECPRGPPLLLWNPRRSNPCTLPTPLKPSVRSPGSLCRPSCCWWSSRL